MAFLMTTEAAVLQQYLRADGRKCGRDLRQRRRAAR